MWEWAKDQETVLSQGNAFNQIFLSQGYLIKNQSPTPLSKISRITPPPAFQVFTWNFQLNNMGIGKSESSDKI